MQGMQKQLNSNSSNTLDWLEAKYDLSDEQYDMDTIDAELSGVTRGWSNKIRQHSSHNL